MTISVLAAFILVLIIPFMFRDFRKSLIQSAVLSDLRPSIEKMEGLGERTNTRYCWFEIPQLGRRLFAEISVDRYEKLKEVLTPATVVLTQLPLCSPRIEAVKWQDEALFEEADKSPKGIYAAVLYLMAGMAFFVWSLEIGQSFAGQLAGYLCALFWVFSGYAVMLAKSPEFKTEDVRKAKVSLLGVGVGSGKIAFLVLSLMCLVASVFLFLNLGILSFLLGIHTTMALGSFMFLLVKF